MSDMHMQLRHNPIAIIGMGAVMPQAHNLREFWNNIVGKVDCITDVPRSRWNIDDYYDPDPAAPDKTYCKRGGFIPDIDFDPLEFGLPPNILEVTDVSQMLSLVVAKEALTDAGYIPTTDDIRERTGVILGVGGGQKLITPLTARLQYPVWNEVLKSYGIDDENRLKIIERMKLAYIRWEENSFPGMLGNVVSGRIANRFDLGGTNCVVDAACASTMAALKMALSELTEGRADMMLTGGVDTDNSIFMYMCFSKTPAFSKSTHPRPFDVESDGMMVGEGIGMMVLKRLDDAERDGDRIYAVIKGIGSSSDGRYKSIYAPRGEGQEKALRRAYDDAGFSPATVGLIEAHGTGTVAGDTTEVSTIIRYFNQLDSEKQHIALGSVKSQIGHTKASAGAAGLIKTALALHHKVLPPTRNVTEPNPKFDMANSVFYVNTETRPWVQGEAPRRAGVSSFGFGGTNFHVVLEEYAHDHQSAYRVHSNPQAVILHAKTPAELQAQITQVIEQLQSEDGEHYFLNLIGTTAIPEVDARVGFVATTPHDAAALLHVAQDMLTHKPTIDDWQHPKGVFYRRSAMKLGGQVVALFAGQGSQYLDMGRELAVNFPEARAAYARLDALMEGEGKTPLSQVVFPFPTFSTDEKQAQETTLQSTIYAQPAIGAMSAGMYRLLQAAGFKADFTAGHSFGEVSALWAAGVLNDDDYFTLVKARGAAMAPPLDDGNFDAGTMMAVAGDVGAIEREIANLPGVQIANRNSKTQVVIAGSKDAVQHAEGALKAKGFKTYPLPVSAAFHTPLVEHAQKPFAQAINSVTFRAQQIPVYSNATGKAYPAQPETIQRMLTDHILQPVLFRDEIEQIYAAGGRLFVEFGPRNVLTNLVKDILGERPHIAIALNSSRQKDSDHQLREAVVQLQVLGLALGTLDLYAQAVDVPLKKKGLNVKLNGASYVSDKTRGVYKDALASGGQVTVNAVAAPQLPTPPQVPAPKVEVAPVPTVATPVIQPVTTSIEIPEILNNHPSETDMNLILPMLENSLAEFREHQRKTLHVYEQYGQSQAEYFRIFFELTQQQQALLASQTLPAGVAEALTQNMVRFHEYQSETLRMHDHYMQQQAEIAQSLLEIIRQQSSGLATGAVKSTNGTKPQAVVSEPPKVEKPVKTVMVEREAIAKPVIVEKPPVVATNHKQPTPEVVVAKPVAAPAAAANGTEVAALSEAMLRIVSEKTGYPAEMLELSMDMEADLGIDSIKRVEILGAMRDEFPNMPQFSPEELGELRTLQQIVDYMRERSGGVASTVASAPPVQPVAAPVKVAAPVVQTPAPEVVIAVPVAAKGTEVAALSEAMLRIVSEKTGYPAEMLEMSMDMEADLGIDSIKRVEILGAMRDEFPDMPQFSPEELGELRTLQQIVDYMRERSGGVETKVTSAPPVQPVATAVKVAAPVVQAPAPEVVVAAPVAAANGTAVAALSEAMLRIVSEKTGYPAEMLEMSMDMEADLGIDSIKRVEILGAMRDEFPNMPQFSPEELGELRTLQQIVDYMQEVSRKAIPFDVTNGVAPLSAAAASAHSSTNGAVVSIAAPDNQGIERSVVGLRRLPVPDYQEFTVDGAACIITDDGTAAVSLLAQRLTEGGWRVIVLSLPDAMQANLHSNGVARVQLPDMTEAGLQTMLAAIAKQYGSIGAFITFGAATEDAMFAAKDKAMVKFAFLMAKHLKPYLTHGNGTGRKCFVAVSRLDGALGTSSSMNAGVIAGGMFGLIKTLSLEWSGVFCRAIDFAPATSSEQVAALVLAEMHDPNRLLTEVAYGSQGRVTLMARQPNEYPATVNGVH